MYLYKEDLNLNCLARQPADWLAAFIASANKQLSRVSANSSSWLQLNSADGREIIVSRISSRIKFSAEEKIVFGIIIEKPDD